MQSRRELGIAQTDEVVTIVSRCRPIVVISQVKHWREARVRVICRCRRLR